MLIEKSYLQSILRSINAGIADDDSEDDEDSLQLVSAISVMDSSRWGASEKRRERRSRSKELLTSSPADLRQKSPISNSSLSSSIAGSSDLDVWSPIQKHFEEDVLQLLSNKSPSLFRKTRRIIGDRTSVHVQGTQHLSKGRSKLVHQIKSDGVLVTARRASIESMTSVTQRIGNPALQYDLEMEEEPEFKSGKAELPTSISFTMGFGKEAAENNTKPRVIPEHFDDDKESEIGNNHELQPSSSAKVRHERGLSVKGSSSRREWLKQQSTKKDKRRSTASYTGRKQDKNSSLVQSRDGDKEILSIQPGRLFS